MVSLIALLRDHLTRRAVPYRFELATLCHAAEDEVIAISDSILNAGDPADLGHESETTSPDAQCLRRLVAALMRLRNAGLPDGEPPVLAEYLHLALQLQMRKHRASRSRAQGLHLVQA